MCFGNLHCQGRVHRSLAIFNGLQHSSTQQDAHCLHVNASRGRVEHATFCTLAETRILAGTGTGTHEIGPP